MPILGLISATRRRNIEYFGIRKELSFKKSKAIPVTDRGGPYGCEMLRIPHCLVNSQMVVRLSALRTGRNLLPRKIPGNHFY
jgi:hypothetical protein